VRSGENPSSLLLVAFWALRLPLLTRAYATTLSKLPVIRVALGRLVEPLTAEESSVSTVVGAPSSEEERKEGIELGMRHLTVLRGPRRMLDGVNLQVRAGERVAIVGHSGSGKSTLLACLLGLVPPSSGELFVDGVPIADFGLTRLRRVTVWVDPAVQLWNRSALANFDFGNPPDARKPLHPVLDQVELMDLLTRMPEGLASELGESGSRLSGGEGQRVRTARALLRSGVRLVLLDEAFRGLERPMRRRFSRALRSMVGGATVIEATHDVADTLDYDRVLVVEHGGLVEDGSPGELLARAGSRYAALVDADRRVRDEVWAAPGWKRVVVRGDGDVEVVGEDRG
jgi:ATP-binding cassette subfamily B protein